MSPATDHQFILEQPREIIDLIFSYLRGDRKSLLACCSSHSFLRSSATRGLVGPNIELTPNAFACLLPVLATPSKTLCEALQHTTTVVLNWQHSTPPLTCYQWNQDTAPFPNLLHLRLFRIRFHTLCQFMDFVCTLSPLEALSISELEWERTGGVPPAGGYRCLRQQFRFSFLDLQEHNAQDVTQWILAHNPRPTIDVLHIDVRTPKSKGAVCNLIQSRQHSLSELQFEVLYAEDIPLCPKGFPGLCYPTNLRHLHLHNLIPPGNAGITAMRPDTISLLLSDVRSSHLEEITITVLLNQSRELDLFDWGSANEQLSIARFPGLKKVRVRISGLEVNSDVALVAHSLSERRLPAAQEQGILVLEFQGSWISYEAGSG
ncbi:hypothetical protein BDQ12DRAFT_664441 [Crucibulum laeve]|uniref:F-box domain-containing protein n=1 Tax=Crucibulum laeve TaxID=68775 RepID=A0A5C3M7U6_9AGAR|nr:hypothetical protein BDQ12DRAFT_664441 [Crucibulum laeve]